MSSADSCKLRPHSPYPLPLSRGGPQGPPDHHEAGQTLCASSGAPGGRVLAYGQLKNCGAAAAGRAALPAPRPGPTPADSVVPSHTRSPGRAAGQLPQGAFRSGGPGGIPHRQQGPPPARAGLWLPAAEDHQHRRRAGSGGARGKLHVPRQCPRREPLPGASCQASSPRSPPSGPAG